MKWFEPLIAIAAIFLVILPIILKIKAKRSGKGSCSCGCDCSSCSKDCAKNFKKYINSKEFKNYCNDLNE